MKKGRKMEEAKEGKEGMVLRLVGLVNCSV